MLAVFAAMVADSNSRPPILVLNTDLSRILRAAPGTTYLLKLHVKENPNLKNFVAKLKKLKLSQDESHCNSCSDYVLL